MLTTATGALLALLTPLTGSLPGPAAAPRAARGAPTGADGVGLAYRSSGLAVLRHPSGTESTFHAGAHYVAFEDTGYAAGDWTGSGLETIGYVSLTTFRVHLLDANAERSDDDTYSLPRRGGRVGAFFNQVVAGDFDGDGIDSVGVYDPGSRLFFLQNANATAPTYAVSFAFGIGGQGIAGDWDGDGIDTIGTYLPSISRFDLRNTNSAGAADVSFTFGSPSQIAVAGDWDGDGIDTVGLYDPATETFTLTNSPIGSTTDDVFTVRGAHPHLGPAQPIAGAWAPAQRAPTPAAGFPVTTPQAVGLNANELNRASALAASLPHARSLVVLHDGELVYERYFHGHGRDLRQNVKSVSKTVLALLVAQVLLDGHLPGITMGRLLPSYFSGRPAVKQSINLVHLMWMSDGLDWDESTSLTKMVNSGDWVDYVADRPLVTEPGTYHNYSTGAAHLGAAALARALGSERLDDYAHRRLFAPLGITSTRWDVDTSDRLVGGAELFLTARDQARLGHLMLYYGFYPGGSIVPWQWVQAMTSPGVHPTYGLWTQRGSFSNGRSTCTGFFMQGHGGQIVLWVPCWLLVVVVNSDPVVSAQASTAAMTDNWNIVQHVLDSTR